jgi:hypothetical protein
MGKLQVNYEILNQKNSPAIYASSLATRPAFGFAGRVFIDTDSPSTGIYRDTGSAWVQVADPGAGTTGTLQNVTTNGNTSNTGISVTANGIGIGTTIPASNRLDIHAASGIQATFNGTGVTNAALQLQSAGVGKWDLRNNHNSGANDFQVYDVLNSTSRLNISNAGNFNFTGIINLSSRCNVNGSTDNSAYALNVNGYTAINSSTDWIIKELTGSGYGLFKQTSTSISIKADNTTRLIIDGVTGNVTLGTVSGTGSGAFFSASGTFTQNVIVGSSATNVGGLLVKGGSSNGAPSAASGQIQIGATAAYHGSLSYDDNTGKLYLDNYYNNVQGGIYFRTKLDSGSAVNVLSINGNGQVNIFNAPVYASNALAIAGGLVIGDIYKSATGILSIVY